jgi:hypothetical protein
MDLTKIKYYPDRFYISLDGFDTDNLTTFITDSNIRQQQAIFIHEYYHYLTNITTFPGIRQFHANFCDRFRIVINLTFKEGINAYPINTNKKESCKELIKYWQDVSEIIDEDDIEYDLVTETEQFIYKRFDISSVQIVDIPKSFTINGQTITGGRQAVKIEIEGSVKIIV